MSTLQRSNVSFRRQGSSGLIWEDKYLLEEDGSVTLRHHLRPSQSTRERPSGNGPGDGAAPPIGACPRSLSTPLKNSSSLLRDLFRLDKSDLGESNKPSPAPKSNSKDCKHRF